MRIMKQQTRIIITLFMLLLVLPLFSQIGRGERYYNSGEYAKAIAAYEKGLRRKKSDIIAMEHLANCYRLTKNYPKAEQWYAQAIQSGGQVNPMTYFYYGTVLKNNNKPDEARKQFEQYLAKAPADKKAEVQVSSCNDIRSWLSQTPLYKVDNLWAVNSQVSDFSPVFFKKGIAFVSDRGEQDLLNGENDPENNRAFLSVYYSEIKTQNDDTTIYKAPDKMPRWLNKDFHNGPISVTADGNMMAFNRVDRQVRFRAKNFINRPKIFISQLNKKTWSSPVEFPYNSDDYSVAHPAFSPDGQQLFFSSDMPGGFGGKDIWVSKKQADGSWGKPENLGADVNTSTDESFPFYRKDGQLYFSSDGHAGFGGLDIFSATLDNGKWGNVVNQGAPLNSPTDDFAIVFNPENNRGYFSSDRPGGRGSDDVYSFLVTNKFVRIAGRLLFNKDGSEGIPNGKITLLNDDGSVLKVSQADNKGNFKFDNLANGQNYMVALDENDPALAGHKKFYMTDEKGTPMRVAIMSDKGFKYAFENLPIDPNGPPQLIADDELITIAGNLITDGNPPNPIANTKVNLKNEKGEIVQTTTTNAFGAFAFTKLPPDQNYLVAIAEGADPGLASNSRVIITNKSGKELMSTTPDANGRFAFKILANDATTMKEITVTDTDLRLDLRGSLVTGDGKNTVLPNTTINVLNEKGELVQSVKTDADGHFSFISLPGDQNYIMTIEDGGDTKLLNVGKLYIKDENGKVIKEIRMNRLGKFTFQMLPTDRKNLAYTYVDDPWLKVLQMKEKSKRDSILIIENIYYDYGEAKILPAAEITLEKVVKVMGLDPKITIELGAHTDSRATNDYNKKLSEKRARAAMDYMIKRGVDAKRLTAVGYGESHLLNKCSDGVPCTEEEHAINRRTEFKINRN